MDNHEFQKLVLEQFSQLNSRLDNLEAGQTRLETGYTELEAGQARLEEGQARPETRQDKLEGGMKRLQKMLLKSSVISKEFGLTLCAWTKG